MIILKNKYNLTQQQNIFLAKKLYEGIIYCGLKLEGLKVSFSQMQTILYGTHVKDLRIEDREIIISMENTWWYILNTVDEPLTLKYITKVDKLLAGRKDFVAGNLDNTKGRLITKMGQILNGIN